MNNYSIRLQLWPKGIRSLVVLLLIALCVCIQPDFLQAQTYFTLGVGSNRYVGDFSPVRGNMINPVPDAGRLNVDASFMKMVEKGFYWGIKLNLGEIEGRYSLGDPVPPDAFIDFPEMNRTFTSEFTSIETFFLWDYWEAERFDSYLGIGFGYARYAPKDAQGRNLRLVPDSRRPDEVYTTTTPIVPIKLGFVFFKNAKFNLTYEVSWVFTTTDYLDNIGELGRAGTDAVFRSMFGVRYRLIDW